MSSLEQSDREAGAVAVAPRVTLAAIEQEIVSRYDLTADKAIGPSCPVHEGLDRLSLCILVLKNGCLIVGKSALLPAESFNAELGRKTAYEHAVSQIAPLMDFAKRGRIPKA